VADILGLSLRMVDYLIARKQMPATKIGRRVLIPKDSIELLAHRLCSSEETPREFRRGAKITHAADRTSVKRDERDND